VIRIRQGLVENVAVALDWNSPSAPGWTWTASFRSAPPSMDKPSGGPQLPVAPPESAKGPPPGLIIEKRGPESHNVGLPFRYEIVARNPGASSLHQVRVVEELPAGARCLSVEPQAEMQGHRLIWELGSIDGGGSLLSAETRTTAGDVGFAWGTGASWARPSSGMGSIAGVDEYSPSRPGGGTTAGMGGGGGTGTRPLFSGAVGVGVGGTC
jgi:hypothetical protein